MNSKAIQILYDEHDIILRAMEIIESLLELKDLYSQSETLLWFITFFREYGNLYHHHKEEDIFFSVLEKKNQILAESIIQALKEHHEMFRDDLSRAQSA